MQDFLNASSSLWEDSGGYSHFSLSMTATESNICLSAGIVPKRYHAWKPIYNLLEPDKPVFGVPLETEAAAIIIAVQWRQPVAEGWPDAGRSEAVAAGLIPSLTSSIWTASGEDITASHAGKLVLGITADPCGYLSVRPKPAVLWLSTPETCLGLVDLPPCTWKIGVVMCWWGLSQSSVPLPSV